MSEKKANDKPVIKVAVMIPNEGHTQVEAYANRLENFRHLGSLEEKGRLDDSPTRFEFYFVTVGRILTPKAREEGAKIAIEMEADYLYMIDDDMICRHDLFERLYRHDVDLVAPLAFTRNFPHSPVLYDIKEGVDPVTKEPYFINHHVLDYPRNVLTECDAVGFGAVLIKMDVLRAVEEPRFMSTTATGEDILFCHKVRKLGFRVFMDTDTCIGHLGHPIIIDEEYRDKVLKQMNYEDNLSLRSKYTPEYKHGEEVLVLGD